MALITCKDLNLSYGSHPVISNLSFSVNAGDYLGIVGENGAGKTTLIKALLSLKNLSAGSILFNDGLNQQELGYLPQQTTAQKDFPASVWEIVLSGYQNQKGFSPFYSKHHKHLALEQMERLSISDLKYRSYRELSGGQQQRVLLARALCATKRLLLLDEPAAGLDPMVSHDLYRLIEQINQEGITVIMVSHDIHHTVQYASHILHLQQQETYFGSKENYRNSTLGHRFLMGQHSCPKCPLFIAQFPENQSLSTPPSSTDHHPSTKKTGAN